MEFTASTLAKALAKQDRYPSHLLVADDILGGFFAINGGAFDGKAPNVFYCAPANGEWEDTQLGYSQFFTGRFAVIYLNFRALPLGWMARGCEKN